MKSPLDKVQDLISLALDGNPDQEEARNAAMTAIRLIRKHDLLVGDFEVGRVRRSPGRISSQKTQRLAEERVNRTVSELVKKSILGEYPLIKATELAESAIFSGEITQGQWDTYYKQLRVCLLSKVRHGVLVSKSGWQGGYQLARIGK
jgi:hypothetical protein